VPKFLLPNHLNACREASYKGNVTGKKVKANPLQAWSGPDDSRKLSFPDFTKTAEDGGKAVSLYPQEIFLVLISVRG